MSEWKEVRLSDYCDLIAGYAFKSKDFGDYPTKVLKIADINPPFVSSENSSGVDLSKYDVSKLEKFLVKKGDYILAMTGATIGKLGRYISDEQAYLNQRVLKFKPHESIDSNFLYYVLYGRQFAKYVVNHIDSESAQPNISAGTIGKFVFNLPDIKEQRSIASILSSLDDKIAINRRICENLEAQAQALFKHWFIDFAPFKNGKFVESELGMIPEGWRVGRLDELGDIVGGATPSKAEDSYYTSKGIAWLTPKDLSNKLSKFTSRGEIDLTQEGYNSCSAKLMPKGSVLFSSRAPIGYLTIAKNDICTNQGFKSVVPKYAGTAYIYYLLKTNTKRIESMSSGTTFKEASGSLMKSLAVIIPPKSIIDNYEASVVEIFKEQEVIEDESARLSTLRDTLLPKLMSGQIKV